MNVHKFNETNKKNYMSVPLNYLLYVGWSFEQVRTKNQDQSLQVKDKANLVTQIDR